MKVKKIMVILMLLSVFQPLCISGAKKDTKPDIRDFPYEPDDVLHNFSANGTDEEKRAANDELNARARAREIARLEQELKDIPADKKDPSEYQQNQNRMEEKKSESDKAKNKAKTDTQNNINLNKNEKDKTNSAKEGDPVSVTEGCYEQNEEDFMFINGVSFSITRNYSSDNKIVSSFGYGWISSVDERIILGIESNAEEVYQKYNEYIDTMFHNLAFMKKELLKIYNIEKLDPRIIRDRIARCESIGAELERLSAGRVYADRKIKELKGLLVSLENDLKELDRYEKEYNSKIIERDAFYRDTVIPSGNRHHLNSNVLFANTKESFEKTGLNTVTLIDGNGVPHLLYETGRNSGIWKNPEDKKIIQCRKTVSGYKVTFRDGAEKEFDADQRLVRITDRNGNFIKINRKSGSKIETIESSYGECIQFTYSDNKISKITNLRDITQNVVYGYKNNKLVSVKDVDGDTVTMDYDVSGLMTSINKSDGSKATFTYGETTSDGKILTTITKNEEGKEERFVYCRNQTNPYTEYYDHDGNKSVYFYDKKHRTVRQIKPDGTVIINNYNQEDNLESIIENGKKTSFKYDTKGNKTRVEYSDNSNERFEYDSYGLITLYADRDGIETKYIRDEKGNLKEYKMGGQTVFSQTFDGKGNVKTRTEYGEVPITTSYEYDTFGNVHAIEVDGIKTVYEYDGRNRNLSITKSDRLITKYEYNGKETVKTDYNGLKTVYETNGRKDLIRITQKDIITGKTIETKIEYDKRHLPVKVYKGNGKENAVENGYIYTPEGKQKARILYAKNDGKNYIQVYLYEKGQVAYIKQFCFEGELSQNIGQIDIENLEKSAGENVSIKKYEYTIGGSNKKTVKVTDSLGAKNLFEYDSFGNLVSVTDGNDEKTIIEYTSAGRVKRQQSAYGGWYEYWYGSNGKLSRSGEENSSYLSIVYNPNGTVRSKIDLYGKRVDYHYDKAGRISSVQSGGSGTWYKYDSSGRVISEVTGPSPYEDQSVYYVTYEYSDDGRSVTVTEGGKYKTTTELDAFGNIIKQTDGIGNEKKYDFESNLVASYDGYNNKTSYKYNALGKISCVTLPDGSKTEYFYDYLGNIKKVRDGEGTVYTAQYDKSGRLIKEKRRAEAEREYEYDAGGRITKVICGNEVVESYEHKNHSRIITVKDGKEKDYVYNYDLFGRLIGEKNRLGDISESFYDTAGQLKSQNNFEGSTTTIRYSPDRTIKTVHYADGDENRFVYDVVGNIVEAENTYGKTRYEYDKGGALVKQTDIKTGEVVDFIYDEAKNRVKLLSSNRETTYLYGKNNEIIKLRENKQRIMIDLKYDDNGRETQRKFSSGVTQNKVYDNAGRVVFISQNVFGKTTWAEGYVYAEDGKRTGTVDLNGAVTLYEYNKRGKLSAVYYPYTKAMVDKFKAEADENKLSVNEDMAENKFLDAVTKRKLAAVLNYAGFGFGDRITTMQLFIKESYEYDKNGNRIKTVTKNGAIDYNYDGENRLVSSGSNGRVGVEYTYDRNGNMLMQKSELKTTKYAYNSQNRLCYSQAIDRENKTQSVSRYAYDAFGRRILVQDRDEACMKSIYDGFTFDIIKQSPTFANGMFTDSNETGLRISRTGRPTGDRYRYLEDDKNDGNRYYNIDEGNYKTVSSRYVGERTLINVNGVAAAQNADGDVSYFTTDLLGSVRVATDNSAFETDTYAYDAFGSLVQGDLSGAKDLGYLGKQFDKATGLYNYGYRDYKPDVARFTTVDPIRDGANWFVYCDGDSVNFVDLWGLSVSDGGKALLKEFKDIFTLNVKVGLGVSSDIISKVGFDLGSQQASFSTKGYKEEFTVGVSAGVFGYSNSTPLIQGEAAISSLKNNSNHTINIGLLKISEKDGVDIDISFGAQVIIGGEVHISVKEAVDFWGKLKDKVDEK